MDRKKTGSVIVYGLVALIFWILGAVLTLLTKNTFALFNFGYLGTSVGTGLILYTLLPREKKHLGRKLSQFLVGLYLFAFLGIMTKMNMQIEGVWFELLFGVATAPLMHYLVAKILGPLIIGRLYCGWGCWTAMILDLLPYPKSRGRLKGPRGYLRYAHFLISILVVLAAWFFFGYNQYLYFPLESKPDNSAYISFVGLVWFLAGNGLYYLAGILLAVILKDNRAFCKYLCPITTFLKAGSRFSLLKIKGDKEKCTGCNSCIKACPMDIDIPAYIRANKRILSSECILCLTCTNTCPEKILKVSIGFDGGLKDHQRFRSSSR